MPHTSKRASKPSKGEVTFARIPKRKAVIAVARKLSVLMLTLWQRECDYEPLKNANSKKAA